jgi:hypothetical protein
MALTDSAIRNAKHASTASRLYDSGGLFMLLSPAGGKLWRFKYRYAGTQKTLIIGKYPEIGLKEARGKRDDARKLLAEGIDPSADKKRKAIAATIAANNNFRAMADEFIDKIKRDGRAQATIVKTRWLAAQLDADLGKRPIPS